MRRPLLRSTLLLASLAVTVFVLAIVVFPGFFGISAMPAGEAAEEEVEGTATVTTATPTAGSLSPIALAYGVVASSPQHTFVIALMRDGIFKTVNVRQGDVVRAGQPIVTVINPDDLWVRADVEESYIDRLRIGDRLTVRLPSGVEREGTVFYRGADAAFATQRDVSRTKRDIKTFEVRLRVDNRDRRLAVGMTAYVLLPVS